MKWNNYFFNFIVQPLQAIYILAIVKFFTPPKSANQEDLFIEDGESEDLKSGFDLSSVANDKLKGSFEESCAIHYSNGNLITSQSMHHSESTNEIDDLNNER